MSDSLADFHARLFSIRPFTETLSPPSSARKLPSHPDAPPAPEQLTPLRRAVSEQPEGQLGQREGRLGESNYKTISSISSTIDMLFSKIEKIKEEFSYALDRPHSETEIRPQEHLQHFHSEKVIEVHENKENVRVREEQEKEGKVEPCLSAGRFILHSQSLPLQDHNENLEFRDYFSNPAASKPTDPTDLFPGFSSPSPSSRRPLQIGDFQLGKCIGSGKFGDVYVCVHRATGFLCAIKKIFKSTLREYGMEGQLASELRIHYGLAHPNVVQLYAHFDDEYHIFLLMEYACDGSLMERLRSGEPEAARAVEQVLRAVEQLHRRRVVHRDIKPENVVVSLGVAKLCDFGWAAVLDDRMRRTFCGTLDYVSPEMKDVGEYNESVDLWSVGVLAFELLAGFPPFRHEISNWRLCGSQRKVRWNWEVIFPPEIAPPAQRFIEALLREDPLERPSAQQCLASPFLARHADRWDAALELEFQFDC